MDIPAINAWDLSDNATLQKFAASVYSVKFHFLCGSRGYVGDLNIIHPDALNGNLPCVLIRHNGKLCLEL